MNSTGQQPLHIFVRSPEIDSAQPFQGDAFNNRSALAEKLTGFLNRLKDGCVIAIDAPWGEGKTWFGRNWKAFLEQQGHKTIFVDAFERDYIEDPFTLLCSEVLATFDTASQDPVGDSLKDASLKLGKALMPIAAKVSINVLGRLLLGTPDISKEVAEVGQKLDEKLADATEKFVESRIAAADAEKKSVHAFREALTEFASKQEKPVVFFVDELDRCRPDFAIRLIERIKHFFDVPNLVFVLLLNREQLERAVQGIYGQGFDAHAYLGKFVHLFFSLPKKLKRDTGSSNAIWTYSWKVAERYEFPQTRDLEVFIQAFSLLAGAINFSLRDVEKAFALLALSNAGSSMHYLAWPIVMKLRFPALYKSLLGADKGAHTEAIRLLGSFGFAPTELWIVDYFVALHSSVIKGFEALTDDQKQALQDYKPSFLYHQRADLIAIWLCQIDVAVD